jgi:hypothetical protein
MSLCVDERLVCRFGWAYQQVIYTSDIPDVLIKLFLLIQLMTFWYAGAYAPAYQTVIYTQ